MKKDRRYINFNDCLGIESTKTYEMIVKYLLHAKSTGYKKKKKKLLDIQEVQGAIGYPIIGCDILTRLVYVPVHRKPGQPANIKKHRIHIVKMCRKPTYHEQDRSRINGLLYRYL